MRLFLNKTILQNRLLLVKWQWRILAVSVQWEIQRSSDKKYYNIDTSALGTKLTFEPLKYHFTAVEFVLFHSILEIELSGCERFRSFLGIFKNISFATSK